MALFEWVLERVVGFVWGTPLVVLLLGGGLVLTVCSRMLPLLGLRHALDILRGRYDRRDDPGEISHFQALTTALSSTIGLGNIGGVAIAISQGGPGAVLWMWVAALVGMTTKFFTCTLAIMYRSRDAAGELQGGPMYVIEQGLGSAFKPLAVMFAGCGLIGCLPIFQANQIAEIMVEAVAMPRWLTGAICIVLAGSVIIGGVQRIAAVASRLVPLMCVLYLLSALVIVLMNLDAVPEILGRIFHDAFTGTAAVGGAEGIAFRTVIHTGVKRAVFSNEAGLGTAPMAHGAARTTEPVREGLVAMLGPAIDTLIVCTLTALIILSTGLWRVDHVKGVSLTLQAFEANLGQAGVFALVLIVFLFGLSTIFGYAYYGRKCLSYLLGFDAGPYFNPIYVASIGIGVFWSASAVVNILDIGFALMAMPNMIATLALAPRVIAATRDYFRRTGISLLATEGDGVTSKE